MNKQILYSTQILHFYNTNQIEKMKINKGELVIREMCSLKPEEFIGAGSTGYISNKDISAQFTTAEHVLLDCIYLNRFWASHFIRFH